MRMIREGPNHFLVGSELEDVRLLTDMAMPEIIAEDRVSVGQSLQPGHQPQWIPRKVVLVEFPYHLCRLIQFDDLVTVAARHE